MCIFVVMFNDSKSICEMGENLYPFFSVNPQSTCLILIIGNEFYVHVIENIIRVSTLQNFSPFLSPTSFLSLSFGILFIEPYSQKHSNSFDFHYFFTCSIISWLYK